MIPEYKRMKKKSKQTEAIEKKLWSAADNLRKNIDASEYKHIVLGLIFLKYISDSFEDLYNKLKQGKGKYENANPEDPDEYQAENIFFVPRLARWPYLCSRSKLPEIGTDIDSAMLALETDNPSLKDVLPKVYAKGNLDPINLGKLIDEFSNIDLESAKDRSTDLLGHVFEYFLGQFGLAEGRKGGQFYTPRSVVKLLVEMLKPYKGRVFDPCSGTGGMFVQSEKFIKEHQGRINDISIYGQESNQTTWRLSKMNLAIQGIDSSQVKWNNEGSFLKDTHPDLKADYIIANPPFNDSSWNQPLLKNDGRWQYGLPPESNANFAWIQHFIYHLKPSGGQAGFVMAKGALTSHTGGEGKIRENIVEDKLVDCIVNLPAKLFFNTQIPASLWFLRRGKQKRKDEILFIDARNLGRLINRRNRVLDDEDIQKIANTYHSWHAGDSTPTHLIKNDTHLKKVSQSFKNANQQKKTPVLDMLIYKDIKGFCRSVSIEEVRKLNYVLSPGRYVGLAEEEDDFDFSSRFEELKNDLEKQIKEEARLNKRVLTNLSKIEYNS